MSNSSDDSTDRQPLRLIYEVREYVQQVRNQYYREAISGNVSRSTREELAAATATYYDVLWEHHDEDAVEDEWNEEEIGWVSEYVGRTATTEVSAPGATSNVQQKSVPALMSVDPERLIQVTKKMDRLAKKLGFSAPVSQVHTRVEITDELVEEVEEWRQQNLE